MSFSLSGFPFFARPLHHLPDSARQSMHQISICGFDSIFELNHHALCRQSCSVIFSFQHIHQIHFVKRFFKNALQYL